MVSNNYKGSQLIQDSIWSKSPGIHPVNPVLSWPADPAPNKVFDRKLSVTVSDSVRCNWCDASSCFSIVVVGHNDGDSCWLIHCVNILNYWFLVMLPLLVSDTLLLVGPSEHCQLLSVPQRKGATMISSRAEASAVTSRAFSTGELWDADVDKRHGKLAVMDSWMKFNKRMLVYETWIYHCQPLLATNYIG